MSKPATPTKKPEAAKPTGTNLAIKTGGTALAAAEVYEEDEAGAGLEDMQRDEFTIPFVRILQSNSPQVENNDPEGAAAGMLINISTGELFSGELGVEFIPSARDHNFVEYVPRDAGGGFVGIRPKDDPLVVSLRAEQGKFGKLKEAETGNEIVESRYLYGLIRAWSDDEDERASNPWTQVVVGFASTQIKKYQGFIGRVNSIKYKGPDGAPVAPPIYGHRWRLTTQREQNKKGKFHGWKIQLAADSPMEARIPKNHGDFAEAKNFSSMIRDGLLKANWKQAGGGGDEPGAEAEETLPGDF